MHQKKRANCSCQVSCRADFEDRRTTWANSCPATNLKSNKTFSSIVNFYTFSETSHENHEFGGIALRWMLLG